MKLKFGKKQIILLVVAVVLAAVMIAANVVLNMFAPILHGFLSPASSGSSDVGGSLDGESPYEYASRISMEAGEDSFVLLKNDEVDGEPYLPLPEDTTFNIFGWGATDQGFLLSGGGSGGTNTNRDTERTKRTTLLQAFDEADIAYNRELTDAYSAWSDFDSDYRSGPSGATNATDAYRAAQNPGSNFYSADLMSRAAAYKDAIVVLCRWGNENGGGGELKNIGTFTNGAMLELTAEERIIFDLLQDGNYNVTVLLNTTNPIEMSFLDEYSCIKACLFVGTTGQSGAKAIPNLLVGSKVVTDANGAESTVQLSPSGRLSDTFANDWQSYSSTYANVGMGGNIGYQEDIYIGYKWYETADAAGLAGFDYDKIVRYPFGYGLSYTTFSQEMKANWTDNAEIEEDAEYSVTVTVTNTGKYAGKEVVQLYYTPDYYEGGIEKASVNLLAFGKTGVLQPGESEDVVLHFTPYELACYDAYDKNANGFKGYEVDKGAYAIKLMKNAHELYGTEAESVITLKSTNGIQIKNDPFTGTEVKNLFTGEDAYADMPVDGSKGLASPINYLSRANHFANFTNLAQISNQNTTAESVRGDENRGFTYTGYDNDPAIQAEVAEYEYGMDYGMYITSVDGGKPTLADLNGESGQPLTVESDTLLSLIADPDDFSWTLFLSQATQNEIWNLVNNSCKGGFGTALVEGLGKPQNADKDGPSGFNDNTKGGDGIDFPFYPTENVLGCSWNVSMMREIGRAQGKVGVQEGVQGWYAPGVNLHRSPYNSRNYEYFSEDGVLSGWLAAGIINGCKEEGVYCYLKHFALAESGQNSDHWFTWTTEQALRELYCKPFEIAVKVSIDPGTDETDVNRGTLRMNVKVSYDPATDSLVNDPEGRLQTGANAMMSAFNCVGGIWSGYNHALLTDMLRNEWGFQGSVITDYGKGYMQDLGRGLKAGQNLWMNTSNNQNASINFNDPGTAYAARQALKGISYTYLDTVYTSGLETTVAAAKPFSPLLIGLWVGLDVVLGLGIAACIVFAFVPLKKKAAAGAVEGAEIGESTESGSEDGED